MNKGRPAFLEWTWTGKESVFMRFDGNGAVEYRLQQCLQTLNYVGEQAGRLYCATHWAVSSDDTKTLLGDHLRALADWFVVHGIPMVYQADAQPTDRFVLLANVRTDPREKKPEVSYAQFLKHDTTRYINDGFGVMHRTDCSVVLLAEQYPVVDRSWGFGVARELQLLEPIRSAIDNAPRDVVVVMGGGKVRDKFIYLEHLATRGVQLLVGPGFSPLFHALDGYMLGRTEQYPELYERARNVRSAIQLPIDYLVLLPDQQVIMCDPAAVPTAGVVVSIGPRTVQAWGKLVSNASYVVANCAMGFEGSSAYTANALMQAISGAGGYRILCGGDTITRARELGISAGICSTGGGATLAYLTGIELPGLAVLSVPDIV